MVLRKLERSDAGQYPAPIVAAVTFAGLVAAAAALWFNWTVKERSLEPRTRARLR